MKRFLQAVAIAVGVLAALMIAAIIILPFIVTDMIPEQTTEAAELDTIQTAMDAMMTDNDLMTVAANDHTTGSLAVNTWTALPEGQGAVPLALYLRDNTTEFYFCWDASGFVYPRSDDPDVGKEPGECPQTSSSRSVSSDASSCNPDVEHLISECD